LATTILIFLAGSVGTIQSGNGSSSELTVIEREVSTVFSPVFRCENE
jgi:hypothetical protein